jgi:CRISPR-associated protein Csm3
MTDIKLYGRVIISGNIHTVTGLHIGGAESAISIGGVDNTVVRDPLTQRPYIPGSSLKGKMRSLMEKNDGRPQNQRIGQATIHICQNGEEYATCDVCHIYGAPGDKPFSRPTRLIVRDVMLTEESVEALSNARTDLPYTEVKWEVAIDRVTSAAVPRQLERVPAGVDFGQFELVYSIYERGDDARFGRVIDGMSLLQDDYLGGSGTRGSGKIAFQGMKVRLKRSDAYTEPETLGEYDDLQALVAGREGIVSQIRGLLPG